MRDDGLLEQSRFLNVIGFDASNIRRLFTNQNVHQLGQTGLEL